MVASSGTGGTIPRTTLVDAVTEQVRFQVVSGTISPGERIRVGELTKQFGVSQIPIREALRRLEAEGLIVTLPQRGSVAADVSLSDLAAIWRLRRVVESAVARFSAESMTADDQAVVESALDNLRNAGGDFRSPEFRDAHRAFHWAILAPGGSTWIRRTLEQLWQGSDRYIQLFFTYVSDDMEQFMAGHEALARACSKRDPDLLERLLVEHITQTENDVRDGLLTGRRAADE
jgi:DNA-binding GntR family transcriptional regulator